MHLATALVSGDEGGMPTLQHRMRGLLVLLLLLLEQMIRHLLLLLLLLLVAEQLALECRR